MLVLTQKNITTPWPPAAIWSSVFTSGSLFFCLFDYLQQNPTWQLEPRRHSGSFYIYLKQVWIFRNFLKSTILRIQTFVLIIGYHCKDIFCIKTWLRKSFGHMGGAEQAGNTTWRHYQKLMCLQTVAYCHMQPTQSNTNIHLQSYFWM